MGNITVSRLEQSKSGAPSRNYQIDALKMLLTILVFICHSYGFLPSGTNDIIIGKLYSFGWMSVQMFFMISGFLMVKSILKRNYDKKHAGKDAMGFVIGKFKAIALPFWISNAMFAFMLIAYYIYTNTVSFQNILGEHFKSPLHFIINLIPEAFCITNVGGIYFIWNNSINWYICVMLFVMIPISYFLITKRDSFIHIFSPVAAILLLGYIKESTTDFLQDESSWFLLIRAVCGLCFGIIAWTIYNKLISLENSKFLCTCLTIIETILYLIFFLLLLTKGNEANLMFPIILLMPIAIAITFSERSYLSKLFNSKIFKHFGTISLYIYLNHWAAVSVVRALFSGKSYWLCISAAAVLTAVLCIACNIGVRIIRFIIKKIKKRIKQEKVEDV